MRVLALDTVSPAPSIALLETEGARRVACDEEPLPPAAAESLAPLIRSLLGRNGVSPGGVDRVAVVSGPGAFTGLRAGVAFARGLSRALGVPLVPVPTFVAAAAALGEGPAVRILLDAGRGDVLFARRPAGGRPEPEGGALSRREAARDEALAAGEEVVDLDGRLLRLAPAVALLASGDLAGFPRLVSALAYGRPSAAEERFGPPCP